MSECIIEADISQLTWGATSRRPRGLQWVLMAFVHHSRCRLTLVVNGGNLLVNWLACFRRNDRARRWWFQHISCVWTALACTATGCDDYFSKTKTNRLARGAIFAIQSERPAAKVRPAHSSHFAVRCEDCSVAKTNLVRRDPSSRLAAKNWPFTNLLGLYEQADRLAVVNRWCLWPLRCLCTQLEDHKCLFGII
jgi:hypothetical protein